MPRVRRASPGHGVLPCRAAHCQLQVACGGVLSVSFECVCCPRRHVVPVRSRPLHPHPLSPPTVRLVCLGHVQRATRAHVVYRAHAHCPDLGSPRLLPFFVFNHDYVRSTNNHACKLVAFLNHGTVNFTNNHAYHAYLLPFSIMVL